MFHCDVCNELLDRNVLIVHMAAHAKEFRQCMEEKKADKNYEDYGFECANCLETISNQDELEAHSVKSCTGADKDGGKTKIQEIAIAFPKNNTKCFICNKKFSNRSGIRYHLNQVHAKIKEFQCEICKASFGAKRILTNHITGVHLGERNFKCQKCDKSFKTNANLYAHMKTHDNDYCFACDLCDKSYKYHHHLKQHHITIHAKENIECELCDKVFPSNSNLLLHMRTHKEEKHTCEICQHVFGQKHYLQAHYRRMHAGRESESKF